MFKIVCDDQLVDISDISQPSNPIASPVLNIKVDHEGDKVVDDVILAVTSAEDAPEEGQ